MVIGNPSLACLRLFNGRLGLCPQVHQFTNSSVLPLSHKICRQAQLAAKHNLGWCLPRTFLYRRVVMQLNQWQELQPIRWAIVYKTMKHLQHGTDGPLCLSNHLWVIRCEKG